MAKGLLERSLLKKNAASLIIIQLVHLLSAALGLLGFGGAGGPIAIVLDQWTVGKAIVR